MKKESKAIRIRKLLLIGAITDAAIAKVVKCHVSYVYMVKKKMDEVMKIKNTLAYVRKITAAEDTGVPLRYDNTDVKEYPEAKPTPTAPIPTGSILDEAQGIIWGDREKTYGEPDVNLKRIAGMWNAYMSAKAQSNSTTIEPEDVCWMMVLLKASRQMNTPKRDNLIDAAGYIGLIERIQK